MVFVDFIGDASGDFQLYSLMLLSTFIFVSFTIKCHFLSGVIVFPSGAEPRKEVIKNLPGFIDSICVLLLW